MTVEPASPIADGLEHQLDPRIILLSETVGWIVTACVAAATPLPLFIVWFTNDLPWLVLALFALAWVLAIAALSWLAHYWPAIDYRHASYRVDEFGIEIRRGVYWRTVVNVPRSRVQHTDVSQGPFERRHGLATLVVYTAGTNHARVSLSGLEHSVALRIREHLLPTEQGDAV